MSDKTTAKTPALARFVLCAVAVSALTGACLDERALSAIGAPGGSSGGGRAGSGSTEAGAAGSEAGGTAGEGGESGSGGENAAGQAGEAGFDGTPGGSSGSGGSTAPATGGAGGAIGGEASAEGGAAGEGPPPCPDLDGNQVADCEESLIENGAFDGTVDGWTNDNLVTSIWEASDARGRETSGSLALEIGEVADRDGDVMLGSRQCVEVSPGSVYRFAVEISIAQAVPNLRAGIQLLVHAGAACSGQLLEATNSSVVDQPAWRTAEAAYLTPLRARSIAVKLAVIKPYRTAGAKVRFDNVLVRAE